MMLKRMLCFFVLGGFFCILSGQVVYVNIIPESVEALTQNTEFINSNPQNLDNTLGRPGLSAEESLSDEKIGQLGMQAETIMSMQNIYFNLPIRYRWKGWTAEAKLPVILKREIRYGDISKSVSGIGDANLRFSYCFKQDALRNESMLHIIFPTGDQNKMVDNYLVPLGNGSLNFILQNTVYFRIDKLTLYNSMSFRFNAPYERILEIQHADVFRSTETITYSIRNGNLFTMNSSVTYPFLNHAAAIAGLSLSAHGGGTLEQSHDFSGTKADYTVSGLSAVQDYVFLDILPAFTYTLYRTDVTLCGRIPVLTIRNDTNNEASRKPEFFLRLSREIF